MSNAANHHRRTAGVTFVELMVVLAILAILTALLMVAVQASHIAARRAMCQSNLHQLSQAMERFVELKRRLPHEATPGEAGGWTVELLPFLEDEALADNLAASPSLSPGEFSPLLHRRPAILTCPAAYEGDSELETVPVAHYAMDAFGMRNMPRIKSHRWSVAIGDVAADRRIPWAAGPEMYLCPQKVNGDWVGEHFERGPHWSGFNLIGAHDQAARFYPQKSIEDYETP